MKTKSGTLLLLLVFSPCLCGQDADHFKVVLSGELVKKLDPGTQLQFWRPESERPPGKLKREFKVSELPAILPKAQYANSPWHVDFWSPLEKASLFSVTLSSDLFAKCRTINIKLGAPKPQLRPFFDSWRKPVYTANISQRMIFRTLPYWDQKLKKLVPSPNVPQLTVVDKTSGKQIHSSKMFQQSCPFMWPQHWYGKMDADMRRFLVREIEFKVRYDSGGLFVSDSGGPSDKFTKSFNFKYHAHMHDY